MFAFATKFSVSTKNITCFFPGIFKLDLCKQKTHLTVPYLIFYIEYHYTPNMPKTFFFLWLYSPFGPCRLTYRRFLELFRHMVGLLGRVICPSQGFYLHRTTQHRKTRTNIHALSGIRTHDPSNQPAKTQASDRTATVTGKTLFMIRKYSSSFVVFSYGLSSTSIGLRMLMTKFTCELTLCSASTACSHGRTSLT
jgi:hypothetical protein